VLDDAGIKPRTVALSSALVLVGLGNFEILLFRLVIVGQFRTLFLLFLESECRIVGAQSHSCCSKLRGKNQTLYAEAGRQAPNILMRKFRFHFMGLIFIYTYRNNDHKVFYDPVPTHDLSGMNSLNTPLKNTWILQREKKVCRCI
jgi:hypothetical protein